MRIGIQGWGSEGDLRPLVALGARLKAAGYSVRLVLSPVDGMDFDPLCRSLDLPLKLVPEKQPNDLASLCAACSSPDPTKISRELNRKAYDPYLEQLYESALELCAQSDLVVGLFFTSYVKAACLKSGVPFVAVHYFPGMIPSRVLAPPLFPRWSWLAPASWAVLGAMMDLAFLKPTAKFFAGKGLPRVRSTLREALVSDRLNLLASSPTLFPPAPDWGEKNLVCGDFVLPEAATPWEPSAGLREFLEAGEKPVLVSLGTMEHFAPARARDLVSGAVREARLRAVVQTKIGDEGRDGSLYFLRWAPHRLLAPRCSAMVVHGGAGTSHAALRAGLPAVVLPFIIEQRQWGGLLHRAGSAPRPLSFWKATPRRLAALLREATGSERLRARAAALAAQVAREDGTGKALQALERLRPG